MADPAPRTSREPLLFAAACLVAGFAFLGSRGLYETDEGRYAEAAREMLVSGGWFAPTLQGVPHVTKPPGTYWLVAAGVELLGRNAWGARLFLGVALAAAAWSVRVIASHLLSRTAGARAGWCFLAMLLPFAAASALTTDMFLAAGVLGSLALATVAARSERPWGWLAGSAAAFAAAAFVKGQAAILPWAAFVAGWAWSRRRPPARVLAGLAAVAVLGLGLAFGWVTWLRANVPGAAAMLDAELKLHTMGTGDHSLKSYLFFPGVLVAGCAPWWLQAARGARRLSAVRPLLTILAWAVVTETAYRCTIAVSDRIAAAASTSRGAAVTSLTPWLIAGSAVLLVPAAVAWFRAVRKVPETDEGDAGRVLLVWACATLVVFEVIPAKQPLYVLPLAAPLAIWAAAGARDPESPWPVRPALVGACVAVLCLLRLGFGWIPSGNDMHRLAEEIDRADPGGALPVAVYAGSDLQGLDFYRDGDVRRVRSREMESRRTTTSLEEFDAEQTAAGRPWLLVAEDDENPRRGRARVLGGRTTEVGRFDDLVLLRVEPGTR